MGDAGEVQGLEAILPSHPYTGEPAIWRPARGTEAEPEHLKLRLRHRGVDYNALLARTPEGARGLRSLDETELARLDRWMAATPGWWVLVRGPGDDVFSAPYDTVEAAIVGALSIPAL